MITGRITPHEEPKKYKASSTPTWNRWQDDDDYQMYGGYGGWKPPVTQVPKLTQLALTTIIASAAADGFMVGSRVTRINGNGSVGTIIEVINDPNLVVDDINNEITPFRVEWDFSPVHVCGTFNYCIEDLRLVSSPSQLPILVQQNETVQNLPDPY